MACIRDPSCVLRQRRRLACKTLQSGQWLSRPHLYCMDPKECLGEESPGRWNARFAQCSTAIILKRIYVFGSKAVTSILICILMLESHWCIRTQRQNIVVLTLIQCANFESAPTRPCMSALKAGVLHQWLTGELELFKTRYDTWHTKILLYTVNSMYNTFPVGARRWINAGSMSSTLNQRLYGAVPPPD